MSATLFTKVFTHRDEFGNMVLSYLDDSDIKNLASTHPFFASVVQNSRRSHVLSPNFPNFHHPAPLRSGTGTPFNMTLTQLPNQSSISAVSSTTSSPGASGAGQDDSDTDMTSPEPEEEWVFQMTDEIVSRLASLPEFKSRASLCGLPTELQVQIFDKLDKIDSVCLGLSNTRSYAIYRALFGTKMPLNTRREGQNPLDRVWEVVGKETCPHCENYRCELYEHIKTWMPEDSEYCKLNQKFGSRAEEGAKEFCHRGKPSKPNRCGRHPVRTTTIHQDDTMVIDTQL